jgi:SAM-dependent methyltransferase
MRRFWDRRARNDALYSINTGIDRDASGGDAFWATGPRDLDWILDRLGTKLAATDTVIEIGSGVGRMTRPLAARVERVIALDVSPEMLRRARDHNRDLDNVSWLVGDGRSLAKVEDAGADACISFVVFQHLPDARITLGYVREIGRVLRPGGWAAIQISDRPRGRASRARRGRVAGAIGALRGALGGGWAHHPAWRGSELSPEQVREVAESAGMRLERVEGAGTQYCFVLLRRRGVAG